MAWVGDGVGIATGLGPELQRTGEDRAEVTEYLVESSQGIS